MPANTTFDITLGAGAFTLPWWLGALNTAAQEVVVLGGAILVLLRIWIVLKTKRPD